MPKPWLVELTNSLNGPVRLSYATNGSGNVVVDLSKTYNSNLPLRSLLPRFHRNQMILGTLSPEIDLGISTEDFEVFLSNYIQAAANFTTAQRLPNGSFKATIRVLRDTPYVIESSSDLLTWKEL